MARATWSGFLSFGLVSIPVGLYTATTDQTVHFNQIHKGTSHRVRYRKVDEETGDELRAEDIVNGFPVGDGEYVVVTPEELKENAPGKSELIEIQDFVDLSDIDPKYFRQTYYLAPKAKGANRAYSLLLQVMRETNKIGIATLVLRDKEHLVAVRPSDSVLILETMYFEDEIRSPQEELDDLPTYESVKPRELSVAKQLVESLSVQWDPTRYENTYRQRIHDLVERKRAGHAVVTNEEERPKSNVVDLMSALRASIDRTGAGRRTSSTSTAPTKHPSARSSTSAKPAASLAELTKSQLLARAKKDRVEVNARMTKSELIDALSATRSTTKKTGRRAS
ncbi:MAG TPA: Ku protein [Acidimicrobiales bacterium]|jgi:DNA end-binding protein Ku|nr:Ku protein [Acidimicrobiales bacterium]